MATVNQIKSSNATAIRNKTEKKSISKGNVADRLDALADELASRGIINVADTTALQTIEGSNTAKVIVKEVGLFEWKSTGTPDLTNSFPAAGVGGGIWENVFPAGKREIFIETLQTVGTLKTKRGKQFSIVRTLGYHEAYDGGGNLYYWNPTSTASDDFGSVLQVAGETTGRYIALFENNIVNAKQFGVRGDGVQDELLYLQAAAAYCGRANRALTLYIPNGVYRTTDQWVIGNKIVPNEAELLTTPYYSAPSINYGVEVSPNWRPFRLIGSFNTNFHFDYSSASIKYGIYWCIRHNTGTTNRDEFGGEISYLKLYGQGTFSGATETTLGSSQVAKNQGGLVVVSGIDMKLQNIYARNMLRGVNLNVVYNAECTHFTFDHCEYGWREIGSNTGTRNNFHAFNYEIAYEPDSSLTIWNGMWAEGPNTVLRMRTANNVVINGFYNEAHGRALDNQRFVIDLGVDDTDPLYNPDGMNGLVINGAFIPASYVDNSYANGIRLRDSVRNVSLIGGNVLSNVQLDSTLNELVYLNSRQRAGSVTGATNITLINSQPSFQTFTTSKELKSLDDMQIRSAAGKVVTFHIGTGAAVATMNNLGLGLGMVPGTGAPSGTNMRLDITGDHRFNGRLYEGNAKVSSPWLSINLTGTQDTYYVNIGNFTGFTSNRICIEVELDSGYITSTPFSLGRMRKRVVAAISSNGASVTSTSGELVEDSGTMSSVFSIGVPEPAGSGVIRLPIKVLSGVTGAEKRGHVRIHYYLWNGINSQYFQNHTPVVSAAETGIFGTREYMKLPTRIEPPAGTSAAGGAPIKLNLSGTLLGTAEAGAIEGSTSGFYLTESTGTRLKIPVIKESTFSGDGIATSFTIPHGLAYAPKAIVQPGSVDAAGILYVETNSTNIIVYYQVAPPTGTNNIKLNWSTS